MSHDNDHMTAEEVYAEVKAIRDALGPKAYVSLDVWADDLGTDRGDNPASVIVYPEGVSGRGDNSRRAYKGRTFREVLDAAKADVAESAERARKAVVRKLALDIMQITADEGECTERALKTKGYRRADILAHHADAETEANRISGGAPFRVVFTAQAVA